MTAAPAAPAVPPCVLATVEVAAARRLSPSFVRVELAAPELADMATGPTYDQRVKLLFPGDDGHLPRFEGAADWYPAWLAMPEAARGHMRTYTVRDVVGEGPDTRVVVDVVVHPGATGPAGRWGERVAVGDRVVFIGPRHGVPWGGIEWDPGEAEDLLLVGDETAVPAISAILEQLPRDARGRAFLEVPSQQDVLDLTAPDGVRVTWLPREGGPRGPALHAAVLCHLGAAVGGEETRDEDVDPDLWETPTHSSGGEDVAEGTDPTPAASGPDHERCYVWVAGEAKVVTGLRRALVRDVGLARSQVAFMGYWREGVAMKG